MGLDDRLGDGGPRLDPRTPPAEAPSRPPEGPRLEERRRHSLTLHPVPAFLTAARPGMETPGTPAAIAPEAPAEPPAHQQEHHPQEPHPPEAHLPEPRLPEPRLPEPRLPGALNPLLSVAAPVLDLAAGLRDRVTHDDPDGVRGEALAALARFEADAAAASLTAEEIRVARFALCATLDDTLRATPWGARARWLKEGLTATLDPEAGGPDLFFELLDTMLGDPRQHRRALELFYACLSLGFEGKYRDRPRGAHDLAHLRDELYRILRRARGEREPGLSPDSHSPSAQGMAKRFRPLAAALPPWTAWAAVALGLGLLWGQLSGSLTRQAGPVAARIAALLPDAPIEIARLAPPPPPTAGPALIARVTAALAPEIRTGAVEVLAGEDGALVVRIPAAAMFATGSEAVKARHRAVVDRVGQALAPEAGTLRVVGHTDDQTPRTGRLPTAQSLTEARAEAVRQLLERHVPPARLRSEGRADGEPVALNDTPAGRDSNRRIDVRLYPQ